MEPGGLHGGDAPDGTVAIHGQGLVGPRVRPGSSGEDEGLGGRGFQGSIQGFLQIRHHGGDAHLFEVACLVGIPDHGHRLVGTFLEASHDPPSSLSVGSDDENAHDGPPSG